MEFEYRPYWGPGRKFTLASDNFVLDHFHQGDLIYREVARRKVFYENGLLSYLAYAATRGGIYVDVGANVGNHSIFFAKYLADFVVPIEPSTVVRQQLERNLAANHLTNQLVVGVAIGKEHTSGVLAIPATHGNNYGAARIGAGGEGGERVEIQPLQSVLKDLRGRIPDQRVTLIKIDAEGMGPQVLEGCREVLAEHHPQIVIEADSEAEHVEIDRILGEFGYTQVARFCATPTYYYVNRRFDDPPARGIKFRLVRSLRKMEEKLKLKKGAAEGK